MKIIYEILYKNGHEDKIEQEVTEENANDVEKISKLIEIGMKEDGAGYISFGDGKSEGYFIRLTDILRVKMTYIE